MPATPSDDAPFNRARRQVTCYVDTSSLAPGDTFRGRSRDLYGQYVLPRLCAGDMTGLILQSCGASQGVGLADALRWTQGQVQPQGAGRRAQETEG